MFVNDNRRGKRSTGKRSTGTITLPNQMQVKSSAEATQKSERKDEYPLIFGSAFLRYNTCVYFVQ